MSTTSIAWQQTASRMQHFYRLAKPRVVSLIVFTAVIGMFLAVPGAVPLNALIFGTLGIALVAGAAALDDREDEAEREHRPDQAEEGEPERDAVPQQDGDQQEHRQRWKNEPKSSFRMGCHASDIMGVAPEPDHAEHRDQRQ